MVHSGCFAESCLICVRKENSNEGVCKSVTCESDSDCESVTSLPSQCNEGQCTQKQCVMDKECPQGMRCFKDGSCKTVSSTMINTSLYLNRITENVRMIVIVQIVKTKFVSR